MPLAMIEEVRLAIERKRLAGPGEPLWVAVSGGVDSMVLLHILRELGHPCKVAHVDHGLRGGASAGDREFVRSHCARHDIPCEVHHVDVRAHAAATGMSIQMAARDLRMDWFHMLSRAGPHQVAMAHHADDAVETFFIGLVRGMGARGWGGIPAQHGPIIRPLLDIPRASIEAYAQLHGIPWREDASNADKAYLRNRIRHELLPMLERWRPGTQRNLARNIRLFAEFDALARNAMQGVLDPIVTDQDGVQRVPLRLFQGTAPLLLLHALLRDKGFHPEMLEALLEAARTHQVGARFHGDEVVVFVDRHELVIAPAGSESPSWTILAPSDWPHDAPVRMRPALAAEIDPSAGPQAAWLDLDQLHFPLELRPWRPGDRMRPAGLGGSKLISDILIDLKVPLERKRRCYVLAEPQRIVWLCGFRLAEGVKASAGSRSVLLLTYAQS